MPTIVTLPLPYTLTPDTLADADQVQADLEYIATQVNSNSATPGQVKATSASTLLGFLQQILLPGSGITMTLNNPGAAETITIASSAASVQVATIQANALCI